MAATPLDFKELVSNVKDAFEEENDELVSLLVDTLHTYVKDQYAKQCVYGVQVENRGKNRVWFVNYNKYRSVQEILELGYFTSDERTLMYKENEKLLYKVFQKYKPNFNQFLKYTEDDIYSACLFGMTKALNQYNNSMNTKFSSYAYQCMSNACLDVIKDSNAKKKDGSSVLSIDFDYSDDGNGPDTTSMANDTQMATNRENEEMDEPLQNDYYSEVICQLLEGLDEKHLQVAYYTYGILGYEKMKQVDIARELYLSKPTVLAYSRAVEKHMADRAYELGLSADMIFG